MLINKLSTLGDNLADDDVWYRSGGSTIIHLQSGLIQQL